MEEKNFSYYDLYLENWLIESKHPLAENRDFISRKAECALDDYDRMRKAGASVEGAHEEAMKTLLKGVRTSPFLMVKEVVEEVLGEEPENELVAAMTEVLAKKRIIDYLSISTHDCENSHDNEELYQSLATAIREMMANGIQQ